MKTREHERRDSAILIILILLLGFFCIIITSGWALRFAPSWRLDTNMRSRLSPNSDFLTSRPVNFVEPLDPAILTNPAWINVFLTPGALSSIQTRTPVPANTSTKVPSNTQTPVSTSTPQPTNTLVLIANPTKTKVYVPPTPINTPLPTADLRITKTDAVLTYNPGSVLTYIITVTNNGPNAVTGATIRDNIPAQITTWDWACTSQTGGASSCNTVTGSNANFSDTINLPNGASIVYTVTANISASATGNLTNTATISVPAGYIDPISGNNQATDTDAQYIPFVADLQITKTDGVTTYTPGSPLTYTVTITNNGPSAVIGAVITDNIPTQITTWGWVCSSQTGGASGCNGVAGSNANFSDTVNLPNGASIVYTVTANISASAAGNLMNIATISVPVGYTDPTPGNNSATDTDSLLFNTDLQITKTDGVATYTPGNPLTYTVTITNNGPTAVIGAVITDNIPSQIAVWDWACTSQTGGANGCDAVTGSNTNFGDTVNLPNGASIVYTVTANIPLSATGNLTNTANVNVPIGYLDPTPGNNTDTDTDTPVFNVDLQITKTDGVTTYVPGASVTYTIVVTNPTGPANAIGATMMDTFPASVSATWTCSATVGANCTTNGSGNINDTVNVPAGGSLTYTVIASIAPSATGNLSNTATITAASGYTGTTTGSATDTDIPNFSSDLTITNTDNSTDYAPNATRTYSIVVSNVGPSNVMGANVTDTSTNANITSWTCSATGGGTCTASGAGNINDTVNVPVGAMLTYTATANIFASPVGTLNNIASVSTPVGVTDSNLGNNTASDTDALIVLSLVPPEVGSNPDGVIYPLLSGNYLTLGLNVTVNGHTNLDGTPWDIVYYERPVVGGVSLDWMIVEISDGRNWYTVFNWGDNYPNSNPDTNSNMNFNILANPQTPQEPDQRFIPTAELYNLTGIAIDLDSVVPPGTYSYIRFYAPLNDVDGQTEIDAVQVLP